ncbi:TnsD family Tn7-like transposition protein [Vibrio methylphosphonaticus]|uniref:TnsD family Tn7-like transposition protein n=1 Tax=Vibrio methylphosphonaticus TaxID=2946866 RepID=UPI00202A094E|nr:TnsD family Tn7-like transposition protein [Vibrio methylphosphonaticus]MCL9775375.1 TnsD family transposase [Vibrio methylphosphonaticus]
MLTHFPIAQRDEMLTSVLARFIQQMGVKDDKVALDILFGNRKIVPSPFLQGHLGQLIEHVGNVWCYSPSKIIEQHTHLPLFRLFLSNQRYSTLETDLLHSSANSSVTRAGIPASLVQWPLNYKICPQCRQSQLTTLGFTYWQRLFQSPGVMACPKHRCALIDTHLPISSPHRHRLVGSHSYQDAQQLTECANTNELKLAEMVEWLFNSEQSYVSPEQWTQYYQNLAREQGFMKGARIDHKGIASLVRNVWSDRWMQQQGIQIYKENTWLTAMFRKHRRMFSYLQHFVVWLSLGRESVSVAEEVYRASKLSTVDSPRPLIMNINNQKNRDARRSKWLMLLRKYPRTYSLKQLRDTVLGARLYSWLYRYDRDWLNSHKPPPIKNYKNKRVDWHVRDLELVKKLIAIKNITEENLYDVRHSKSWFSTRIGCKSLLEKKIHNLPLCRLFFDRYSESVEEYQTRRLSRVMVQLIDDKDILRPVCEIERLAGLSRTRSRKPAREILRLDIPAWQRAEVLS